MYSAIALLNKLKKSNICLSLALDKQSINYEGPKKAITQDVLQLIADHKTIVIKYFHDLEKKKVYPLSSFQRRFWFID